ncbi:B12-binding domain-containing radical SAM protein [Dehalococcoides mccartyi]|uniref:PqqD family peptide modification chaperone n=1 Tax=Dehalococcoides mccartyi TaxID=61435 RepID=UPI0009A4B046|nr:PqqD family peptide modification chaperone [Dehalococcoides mccartyi]AQY73797.1 B12-binding domain-containing radical SAM protein [Dehalococcoides mccartyi]
MKTLLIFPPQWIPYQPYLSLPSLTAYLKEHGVDTVQYDFNLEAYKVFFSEEYLRSLKSGLNAEFKRLDSSRSLSPVDQQYYNDLFIANTSLERVAGGISQAKKVFHDKNRYYDPDTLAQARETLNQAMAIISTAHFPTRVDLSSFEMGAYLRSYRDIKDSTADNEQNPYIKLCREKLLPFVSECCPDIIGISVAGDSQLLPALTLARQLKSANPQVHIVIGGYIVSLLADVIARHEELFKLFFDSAVVNEGEQPLLELANCLRDGRSLSEVPNLIYFDGQIQVNKTKPSLKINSLPTPCFDGLNLKDYLSPEPVLPLLGSRGCYWGKCAFCSHNEAYGWHYQKREAAKIAEDMRSLSVRHKVDKFAFADEGLAPSLADALSDELIKGGIQVSCSVNVRLESRFTPELCLKMRKAGFRVLFLGLESGCNRVLEHMEKGTTREIAVQVCRNIYRADIWNHLYVFLGFPTESEAEAGETIDFLADNRDIIRSFNIDYFSLGKGSAVARLPEKYGVSGIIESKTADEFKLSHSYKTVSGLSSQEACEMSIRSWTELINKHPSRDIFKRLMVGDLLLYVSRYPLIEDLLKAAQIPPKAETHQDYPVSASGVPRLDKHLTVAVLNFDLLQIKQNISRKLTLPATPVKTPVVYEPVKSRLVNVTLTELAILRLCDGQRDLGQITAQLAAEYNAPEDVIEKDCRRFLLRMREMQIISF